MPTNNETMAEAKEIGRRTGIAEATKLVKSYLKDALKAGDGFLAGWLNTLILELERASNND